MSSPYGQPILQPDDAEFNRTKRKLLAVAFVAVVLLGPSFMLGYMAGYRSGRASVPQNPTEPAQVALPPPAKNASPRPKPTQPQKPAEPVSTKEAAPDAQANRPAAGQIYLQLVATDKSRSSAVAGALRSKGFAAVELEIPEKPGLYRVLVGPLQTGDLDKTRADLQSKGFAGAFAIKRTF